MPDIPGRNGRERIANVARLLLFGVERLQHRRAVKFEEVKAACIAHRCYDRSNLGTALKNQQVSFVLDGRRRDQTIALTDAGRREAERLVRRLSPP